MRRLVDLIEAEGVLVLSGAGLSTESGIPDYRGPTSVRRSPMTYQEFASSATARQRYWARSHVGWRVMSGARPNAGHVAVAGLQAAGRLHGIITQNVDGLHQAGGAHDVLELHGSLASVVCLDCGDRTARSDHSARLASANPSYMPSGRALPDGDVELGDTAEFVVVACERCGGVLKPDVVFFGENVPAARVSRAFSLTDSCRALLVLGSSLTVRSGYRFVVRAAKLGIPVAIVNQGPTRGDDLAVVRVDAALGYTLSSLVGLPVSV